MLKPQPERRAPDRPVEGDRRLCPFCHVGSMVFREEYGSETPIGPAWVCESPECGYRTLLRHSDRAAQRAEVERARALRARSVKAHRTAMKVRARAADVMHRSKRVAAKRSPKTK